MAQPKPLVVVTRKLPDVIETRLMELFETRLNRDDRPMSQAEIAESVKTADVLVPTVTDQIDKAILTNAGPRLKLIASFGTGVDHIDLATARQRGISVTNTPGVLTEDTADMTMAHMLAVPRRLTEGERVIRSGKWEGWGPTMMLGHRIWGKRLGIIGMGRIGQAVAKRAMGFGLSIHYHNRRRVHKDIEAELEVLNARRLDLMKATSYIVNTSRGEVIDENALARKLGSGQISGAGLDVFEHEPAVNPKLMELDNVVLLPHMGSATLEGRVDMGEKVIINIKTFVDGHTPPDRVLETMF
ncbi:MAG: D-glycerate dehydrogenase [Alphaproteobacteria bacterium]